MKKRIVGLFALVVCLMFAFMSGAMAFFMKPQDNEWIYIMDGCLIEGGSVIAADTSGANATLRYGVPSDVKKTVEFSESADVTIDPGFWHVWAARYYTIDLEPVGAEVMKYLYSDHDPNAFVRVFASPLSRDDWQDAYNPQEIENMFAEWVSANVPDASFLAYDANVYREECDGFWAPCYELPADGKFYLPNVGEKVLAVLHWTFDGVETLPFDVTEKGVQVYTTEFSPFAVVYQSVSAESSTPPATGDNSPLLLLSALAGASLAGMVLITVRRRKVV